MNYYPTLFGKRISHGSFYALPQAEHFLRRAAVKRGLRPDVVDTCMFIDRTTGQFIGEIKQEILP